MNTILVLRDPNSTTAHNFYIYEAGAAPINHYQIPFKQHLKKVNLNGNNNGDPIEKKLLCYALATFFGHAFVASHFVITDIWLVDYPKIRFMMGSYYPLFLDTEIIKIFVSAQWRGPKTIIIAQLEELLVINCRPDLAVPYNNCQQTYLKGSAKLAARILRPRNLRPEFCNTKLAARNLRP
uniref:Uncharacterized protein n=1 Tax=Globodera rostochiensis TaxID=31243 RepID=A0A914HQV8_GLORO